MKPIYSTYVYNFVQIELTEFFNLRSSKLIMIDYVNLLQFTCWINIPLISLARALSDVVVHKTRDRRAHQFLFRKLDKRFQSAWFV